MSEAHSSRPKNPTLEQLRAVAQPPEVRARKNAEHWTAELYLRHISIYLTALLVRTPITANGVTGLM
ncbi:transferase, partial [Brevibacterium paucivorans]